MELEEASIRLMDKEWGRTHVTASRKFDSGLDIPLIKLEHTAGKRTNRTWPTMTIADATELRDALTILIDEKEEA